MGLRAKEDFPEIEFSKSIMVGDSISDMEFGLRLGMKNIYCNGKLNERSIGLWDYQIKSLIDFYFAIFRENN
jgi:histidinol phosphatase-like enzyme